MMILYFLFLPLVLLFTNSFFFGLFIGFLCAELNDKLGIKKLCKSVWGCLIVAPIFVIEAALVVGIGAALGAATTAIVIIPSYII